MIPIAFISSTKDSSEKPNFELTRASKKAR